MFIIDQQMSLCKGQSIRPLPNFQESFRDFAQSLLASVQQIPRILGIFSCSGRWLSPLSQPTGVSFSLGR